MNIKVIYEDDDILAIDKPAHIETIVSSNKDKTIEDIFGVKNVTGHGIVHRLDKDTSGVMVLAKTEAAAAALRKQFEERKVTKQYIALVHGEMKESRGLITTPVQRYPKDQFRSAITEWKVVRTCSIINNQYSILELSPHTGRTHQLRKHLKSIGHPIVSDPIYGFRKKLKSDLSWCPRLFLHAQFISFLHPTTGEQMEHVAPLPSDLRRVIH